MSNKVDSVEYFDFTSLIAEDMRATDTIFDDPRLNLYHKKIELDIHNLMYDILFSGESPDIIEKKLDILDGYALRARLDAGIITPEEYGRDISWLDEFGHQHIVPEIHNRYDGQSLTGLTTLLKDTNASLFHHKEKHSQSYDTGETNDPFYRLSEWVSRNKKFVAFTLLASAAGLTLGFQYKNDKNFAKTIDNAPATTKSAIISTACGIYPFSICTPEPVPISTPEIPVIIPISKYTPEFLDSLKSYSPELRAAFLGIPDFSDDNIIQPDEKEMLDTAQSIFSDPNLKKALETLGGKGDGKILRTGSATIDGKYYYHDPNGRQVETYGITLDIHKPDHLKAFLEVMHAYNPEQNQNFTPIFEKYGISKTIDLAAGEIRVDDIDGIYEPYGANEECGSCIREGIKSLAHVLWIERENKVPWSITDYNDKEMEALINPKPSSAFAPGWTVVYPDAINITNGSMTQKEALEKIVDWLGDNVIHITDVPGFRWDDVYGEDTIETLPIGTLMDYRTHKPSDSNWDDKLLMGAKQSSGAHVALTRAVNIPGAEILPHFSHSNTHFPSEGLYSDGNWIFDRIIKKAPPHESYIDRARADELFFDKDSNFKLAESYRNNSIFIAKKYGIPIPNVIYN